MAKTCVARRWWSSGRKVKLKNVTAMIETDAVVAVDVEAAVVVSVMVVAARWNAISAVREVISRVIVGNRAAVAATETVVAEMIVIDVIVTDVIDVVQDRIRDLNLDQDRAVAIASPIEHILN